MGPLAYLLKNRFYIGEVVYRGEVHRGEHEPILDRDLFEAVQEKLAAKVETSTRAREEAKTKLAEAKHLVEEAIESQTTRA